MWGTLVSLSKGKIKQLIWTGLGALGVSMISIEVIQYAMERAFELFQGYVYELPLTALQLLGMCDVDLGLNLILSAWMWRLAISVFIARRF